MTETPPLKLRASDAEDVQVISAMLQDAIVPFCDMTYRAEDKNFIAVAQRLRREPHDDAVRERICCAINVRGVENVQTQNINPAEMDRMLDLLAVLADTDSLTLMFAGDAKIRLKLKDWSLLIEDFGEAWPTACTPCHDGQGDSGLDESQ